MKIEKVSKKVKSIALNTHDAAKYLGVSESLLNKLRQTGDEPRFCRIGKKVVYETKELKRFLKSKRV
jgi:predicted transcriptional regulator